LKKKEKVVEGEGENIQFSPLRFPRGGSEYQDPASSSKGEFREKRKGERKKLGRGGRDRGRTYSLREDN